MLVRLRDFAEIHRVSERTVQLHVKENWDELQEHIARRGKQGTWLDDYAQEFLLNVIQLPSKDEVLIPTAREAALLVEIAEANRKLADAERIAREFAEAAGKTALLEAANESQAAQIAELAESKGRAEQALKQEQEAHAADNAAKDDEIIAQRQRAEAAEAELNEIKNMRFLKRLFWKG